MPIPNQSGNRILPIAILGAMIACQIANCDPLNPPVTAQKLQHFGDMPISFEPNRGQASADAYFVSRGINSSLSLLRTGARLDVAGPDHNFSKSMNLEFVNANSGSGTQGLDELRFKSYYFIGNNRDKWLKDIPNFAKVRYSQMWKGVDVVFYGNENRLEYDLVIAPGANPKTAAVAFPGTTVRLQENGDLVLHSSQGDFLQNKPIVYQMAGNRRELIPARYIVAGKQVSFEIGKYDHSRELIIDPAISYSLGRIDGFYRTATGASVDASGNSLIGGTTYAIDVGPGLPKQTAGWVARMDPVGNIRSKFTFTAVDGPVTVNAVATDANGSAYVTGSTGGSGFPLMRAYQASFAGGTDAFLSRFDFTPNGATDQPSVGYSTYLGGSSTDSGNAVAVLNSAHVFVAGSTTSSNFPKTNGVAYAGGVDAFVTQFNTNGTGAGSLLYSWNGGGSGDENALGIGTDAAGNAYVGGNTTSQNFQPASSIGYLTVKQNTLVDGFLLKLTPAAAVSYFTYVQSGPITAVAADSSGNAYGTGQTTGQLLINGGNQGFQLSGGANHAFIVRFNTNANGVASLVYGSYLGGAAADIGTGIATDGAGNAFVVGNTNSSNFPTVGALQPGYGGGTTDAFLSVFNTNASGTPSLTYSSFLGGNAQDTAGAVGLTPYNNPVVVGSTFSTNFGIPPDTGNTERAFATKVLFEAAPFGSFDVPNSTTGLTNLAGAFAVGGWALSTITVANVGIWRDPVPGEPTSANGFVFLVNATMIAGSRPDIAAAFPGYPHNNYGWGAQILTTGLPGTGGLPLGNGTYRLHAIATDPEGLTKEIGTPVTVSVNNSASVLPFGTIDTPTQGGTASGSAFVNFGWVLTPQPNIIPFDGSTITVYIDNVPVGHPTYNFSRCDVAFQGLRNSGSTDCTKNGTSPGPVGFFNIDTTKLTNGLHTISWGVSDSGNHTNGIGSRFFIVQN